MKDSFIFYKEWKDAISDLPNDVRLEIYEAIIEYGTSGKFPVLKPIANVAFNFIKAGIDRNAEKYNDAIEKRREAGRISAEKRKQLKESKHISTNSTSVESVEQKATNSTHVGSVEHRATNSTVNDNDNDNVNDNENKDNTPNGVQEKAAAKAATLKRREKFKNTLFPFIGKYDKEMVKAFFDYWSELNKSETKMRFEMQKTWEVGRRLATWANNENNYGNNRKTTTSKQEANEYAVQLLSDRLQQREQSVFGEIPKPF